MLFTHGSFYPKYMKKKKWLVYKKLKTNIFKKVMILEYTLNKEAAILWDNTMRPYQNETKHKKQWGKDQIRKREFFRFLFSCLVSKIIFPHFRSKFLSLLRSYNSQNFCPQDNTQAKLYLIYKFIFLRYCSFILK